MEPVRQSLLTVLMVLRYVLFVMMASMLIAHHYEKRPLCMVLLDGWNSCLYSGYDMAVTSHRTGFIDDFRLYLIPTY